MVGYWPSSFAYLLTKPKNERGQNPAILNEQAWLITDLLYSKEGNFFTGPTRKIPRGQDGPISLLENPIRTQDSLHLARLWIQPYYKKLYHSEVVSVVDIDRCNRVSLVCLG